MPYLGETLAMSAALFWAIGVIYFKKSGDIMSPLSLNMFKNLVAIILLSLTIPVFGSMFPSSGEEFFPDQPLSAWIILAVSGFIGIALADTLFFVALRKLGASLTAVVDTSYTPLTVSLSFIFLGERLEPLALFGAALIVGALLVGTAAKPEPGRTRRDIILGTVIGVSGMLLMAIGILMMKGPLNNAPLLWSTWVRLVLGSLGLLIIIMLSPKRRSLIAAMKPSKLWKIAIPASIFGTYLSLIAWMGGMKFTKVAIATPLNQLSTIFIFILALVILKEPLTWRRVLAIILAFAGALLVVLR